MCTVLCAVFNHYHAPYLTLMQPKTGRGWWSGYDCSVQYGTISVRSQVQYHDLQALLSTATVCTVVRLAWHELGLMYAGPKERGGGPSARARKPIDHGITKGGGGGLTGWFDCSNFLPQENWITGFQEDEEREGVFFLHIASGDWHVMLWHAMAW